MREAISCRNLTKYYGRIVGVCGLDLSIPEGVIFGFLGPNGAGKTTTIKLLAGLSKPSSGKIWIYGKEMAFGDHALHSYIGYLPEEPKFYGWMTGREFLEYIGGLFGLRGSGLKGRVEEMIRIAGLEEAADRRIGGYSRGMRQRLGVAQALMNRPPLLLLDEPCSALDPIGRKEILEMIANLKGQATVFMSTHILSDVERVCDMVGIIDHGRLLVQASVDELRERYAKPVFLVHFESDNGTLNSLADRLSKLPWINRVDVGKGSLRITVEDVGIAKKELPNLVASSGLIVLRYELISPTLEEIFVGLVGGEG